MDSSRNGDLEREPMPEYEDPVTQEFSDLESEWEGEMDGEEVVDLEDLLGEEAGTKSCGCRGKKARSAEEALFDLEDEGWDDEEEWEEDGEEEEDEFLSMFLPPGFDQFTGTLKTIHGLASKLYGLGEEEGEEDDDEEGADFTGITDLVEQLADRAAATRDPRDADALAGGITINIIVAHPDLRPLAPLLARNTIRLVRALRRSPRSRILVRTVPSILRGTVRRVRHHVASGRPIRPSQVTRIQARQTRRVLGSRRLSRMALRRNALARRRSSRRLRSTPTRRRPARKRMVRRAERFE